MNYLLPTEVKKGQFLIASPEIDSGLFARGVLLLCEHNETGSFGLLINKPLDIELPEDILNLKTVANKSVSLRAGGPVQTNQMMLLHSKLETSQQMLNVCENVYLGGDLTFLQELLADESGSPIHLCFGYAGWTPGQLEREFLDGGWFIYPATKQFIFETSPDLLWSTLLSEMGGRYSSLAMIPENLSVN